MVVPVCCGSGQDKWGAQLEGELQCGTVQLPGHWSPIDVFLFTLTLVCGKDKKCHKNEVLNNQPLLIIRKHSPLYSMMFSS